MQREIDNLAATLNPDPISRADHLQRRINDLQQQLADVQAGHVPTLTEAQAVEAMRDMYALATSLRADFRRVEDSWREADRTLRQAILGAQHHRGAVVDQLLEGHSALLNTQEGRVFESFQQQLDHESELKEMGQHIRAIVENQPGLELFQQAVDDLMVESDGVNDRVVGAVTQAGVRFRGRTVVLTAGTFLDGARVSDCCLGDLRNNCRGTGFVRNRMNFVSKPGNTKN